MNVPNKLEHYTIIDQRGLPVTKFLANFVHSQVTRNMMCVNTDPGTIFTTLYFHHNL
jgi:hypothetical protein